MAVYKVPQDVEADDKLLGPFSFRQVVYLFIVGASLFVGWGLSRLFVPLAIIPLPVIIFFGLLALPLRKDQPMEIYMAAIVSFYLKPRKRLWSPDGVESLVEITAPKTIEVQRTKDLSQTEAERRLSYLADIVDTGGWAVRGVASPETNSAMRTDAFFEAQQAEDVLDDNGGVAQSFDAMISQADAKRRQAVIEQMQMQRSAPTSTALEPAVITQPPIVEVAAPVVTLPITDPYASLQPAMPEPAADPTDIHMDFNPYPTSMHQAILQPLSTQPTTQPGVPTSAPLQPENVVPTTSETPVSPDIIDLAHSAGLSIETIAHEAKRLQDKKKDDDGEVVISLR